jgi:arabinofuranosyltransferase
MATPLAATAAFFAYKFLNFSAPQEDAAILMRYAQHIAQGHGIVWNVGGPPVDGGTDFLSMLMMAAIVRSGLSPAMATWVLGLACHAITGVVIYLGVTRIGKLPALIGCLCAVYFLCGPGLLLISAGFTTPVFTLTVAIGWYLGLAMTARKQDFRTECLFAFALLVTGLTRPEGVLLAGFMALGILSTKAARQTIRPLAMIFGVFLVLGGAYFLWRWRYFGHPLPNPYYKKGGFELHYGGLTQSVRSVRTLLTVLAPAYLLGLRNSKSLRLVVATAIPIVLFTAIWVLVSDDMNFMMRFQYPIFPIAIMSAPLVVKGLEIEIPRLFPESAPTLRLIVLALSAAGVIAALVAQFKIDQRGILPDDGRLLVGKALQAFGPNHVMATTEAGLLPLYSEWTALDAWGLNDPWIAHNKGITEAYLEQWHPDLIAIHGSLILFNKLPPPDPGWMSARPDWQWMITILKKHAASHHFRLASAVGYSPANAMIYYVRADAPDAAGMIESIKAANAESSESDRTLDFAELPGPWSKIQP